MPRTWKVCEHATDMDGTTYEGFNREFKPIMDLEAVALVFINGQLETYAVDVDKPMKPFLDYLTVTYGENWEWVGVYSKHKG